MGQRALFINAPKATRYVHHRLRPAKGLHHLRTVTVGKHRVIVGCPTKTHKGRCPVPTVAQAVLHPKSEHRTRKNPTLAIFGAANPVRSRKNPKGTRLQHLMSNRVYVVEYQHKEDGKNYKHEFGYGVRMYALSNGDILLTHPNKQLWGNFR